MIQNINHFKERLEEEKATLEKELKTVGSKNPGVTGEWDPMQTEVGEEKSADRADVADSLTNFESNTSILKELEAQLFNVTEALQKIKKGTYGICEVSGHPIEEDRLEANPSARTCKEHMNS